MRAFFEECRTSAAEAERGRWTADTSSETTAVTPADGEAESPAGAGGGRTRSGAAVESGPSASARPSGGAPPARSGRRGVVAGGEGFTARLHECAEFVAVLALLFQTIEEWDRCKHFVLVRLGRVFMTLGSYSG